MSFVIDWIREVVFCVWDGSWTVRAPGPKVRLISATPLLQSDDSHPSLDIALLEPALIHFQDIPDRFC